MKHSVISRDHDDEYLPACKNGRMPGATVTPDHLRPLDAVQHDTALRIWDMKRSDVLDSAGAVAAINAELLAFAELYRERMKGKRP